MKIELFTGFAEEKEVNAQVKGTDRPLEHYALAVVVVIDGISKLFSDHSSTPRAEIQAALMKTINENVGRDLTQGSLHHLQ